MGIMENLHPLLNVAGNRVTRDEANPEVLNFFFASALVSKTSCSPDTQAPELVDRDMERTVGAHLSHFFTLPFSITSPFSSRLVTIALQSFEYPLHGQTSMFLLLLLLNMCQLLFNITQVLKHAIQRSVQRQES